MSDKNNGGDAAKKLRGELFYDRKNGYEGLTQNESVPMDAFCADYKRFLDEGKTERESVATAVAMAAEKGYVPYSEGLELKPGAKIYAVNRNRAVILMHIGNKTPDAGLIITAAHIDSPRIDLKCVPAYEDGDMLLLKTHYYGGIRKYQWTALPLELHGVVITKDGETVNVCVGVDSEDPVFTITDLLPHLAKDQSAKPLGTAFTGENLNVLAGSLPYADDGNERIKLTFFSILNDKYGITEKDLITAELALVPAGRARDVGLDRSMVGAYGQDDRVCGYSALRALLDLDKTPDRTAVCILADKEEIGSEGVSGMQSHFFDSFATSVCASYGVSINTCFANSVCLSADVACAYDPNFADVFDKRNTAMLNGGLVICKYTGAAGKSGSNDAGAETFSKIAAILNNAGVIWQTGELGKVDQGGGGTVAKYLANRNIDTIDAGTAVLSMHSPFEVTGKLDIYMTYKGVAAFFAAN